MGAELGATTSVFPFDQKMVAYMNITDRSDLANLASANKALLVADPEVYQSPEKYYDQIVEVDLSKLEPHVVGPHTPDLARPISKLAAEAKEKGYPVELKAALIGSCTNSSYEDISRSAHIAQQGLKAGLKAKTSFLVSPGSERIYHTMKRDGFLDTFEQLGGTVLSNSCGPCIGQWKRADGGERQGGFDRQFLQPQFPRPQRRNQRNAVVSRESRSRDGLCALPATWASTRSIRSSRAQTAKSSSSSRPVGEELPAKGFAKGEEGYVAPADNGEAIDRRHSADQRAVAVVAAVPALGRQGFRQAAALDQDQGQNDDRPYFSGRSLAEVPRPLGQDQRQHVPGANSAFASEPGKGTNVLTGETNLTIAQIARAYKAKGHRVDRRRRRELRRGQQPRARGDVAAVLERARGHHQEFRAHP